MLDAQPKPKGRGRKKAVYVLVIVIGAEGYIDMPLFL